MQGYESVKHRGEEYVLWSSHHHLLDVQPASGESAHLWGGGEDGL